MHLRQEAAAAEGAAAHHPQGEGVEAAEAEAHLPWVEGEAAVVEVPHQKAAEEVEVPAEQS